jgi:hypothetical protein
MNTKEVKNTFGISLSQLRTAKKNGIIYSNNNALKQLRELRKSRKKKIREIQKKKHELSMEYRRTHKKSPKQKTKINPIKEQQL